jgi:hypothetical protein
MRKFFLYGGLLMAAAVGLPVGFLLLTMVFPQISEQMIEWTCREPTSSCVTRMRGMGHVWAQKDNMRRAHQWYARAGNYGDVPSKFHAGWTCEKLALDEVTRVVRASIKGEEVASKSRQYAEYAAAWYKQAADKGFAPAMNNLAELYLSGMTGRHDNEEIFRLHLAAAEAGNFTAAANVQIDYLDGRGVARDPAKAEQWAVWTPKHGLDDIAEPTFGRTNMFGEPIPAERRAFIRAAAEQNVPVTTKFTPMKPNPNLPTFKQVQEKLRNEAAQKK